MVESGIKLYLAHPCSSFNHCLIDMLFDNPLSITLLVELQKAQNHLQNKYVDLEQKYNLLVVESGGGEFEKNSFVGRLLNSVAELYDKELYR